MKNRTFYATFLLFLVTIYSSIFILSIITLHDTVQQAKKQCLDGQYLIVSSLYSDIMALKNRGVNVSNEIDNLIQPYMYLAGNNKTTFSIYQNNKLLHTTEAIADLKVIPKQDLNNNRIISINRNNKQYLCSISSNLPEPFNSYFIFYQIDITESILSWEHMNNIMLMAGGSISLLLALFLMFILEKLFSPLSQITRLSKKIADGDYSVRLPEKGKDEIAQMANSFNYMTYEIENKITELAAAAENRQRFVDNFAHELRTPLTAIYGYAEYIQKASLTYKDRQFALNTILSESQRMQKMANQLMELSNLRTGAIHMEKHKLSEILDSVKLILIQKLKEKNINFQISSNVETITCDTILLQSLLINLIDNAIKASNTGGTVIVETFYQDSKPVISVSDNGKGMKESELTQIVEPYYRVDKSRNHKEGGAGLGLAICHQIAIRHRAELLFKSKLGSGTTAMIIFTTS